MLAPAARLPLATLSPLAALLIGCGGEGSRTTTVAATVTAATRDTAAPAPASTAAPVPAPARAVSYEAADSAFRAGRYGEAAELFAAYTESKPDNPWGFYMLGISSWKAGDLDRAELAFERALERDPGHLKSLLNSTRVLLELGRVPEALQRVEAALALEPSSGEAHRLLARVQDRLGDGAAAAASYRHAIALDDRDAWAMNNLGVLYLERGYYAEALPPLARAVELRSTSPVFQNNLGQALERVGYFEAARGAYEAALAADSGYAKAAVGLERVIGRTDDPSLAPLDLAALAREFQSSVESWRAASGDGTSPGESAAVTEEPRSE